MADLAMNAMNAYEIQTVIRYSLRGADASLGVTPTKSDADDLIAALRRLIMWAERMKEVANG